MEESTASSVKYNKYKDAAPILVKIKAGAKIQIDSNIWFSDRYKLILLLNVKKIIIIKTTLRINNKIKFNWSWKKINSNII
jgi:hypothetical protein